MCGLINCFYIGLLYRGKVPDAWEWNESRDCSGIAITAIFLNYWRGGRRRKERVSIIRGKKRRQYNLRPVYHEQSSLAQRGVEWIQMTLDNEYFDIDNPSRNRTHATLVTSHALYAACPLLSPWSRSEVAGMTRATTTGSRLEQFRKLNALHLTYLK